jgi:hypothetical protein
MKVRGKNFIVDYDETVLEVEIAAAFKDQVVVILRATTESR